MIWSEKSRCHKYAIIRIGTMNEWIELLLYSYNSMYTYMLLIYFPFHLINVSSAHSFSSFQDCIIHFIITQESISWDYSYEPSEFGTFFGFSFWMNNTLIMASRNVYLVSAGYDSVIRFWDISGGHTKRTLRYEENSDVKVKMVCIIDVILVTNSRLIVFPSLVTDLI